MKKIKAIILKDLQKHFMLLLLWLFILVAQAVVSLNHVPQPLGDTSQPQVVGALAMLLHFFQILLQLVLVGLIVQEDNPNSSNSFWLARPISAMEMIAAKGLFFCGLVMVVALVEIFRISFFGFSVNYLLRAFPEILMTGLAGISCFWALASITKNFSQYIIAVIIVWLFSLLSGIALPLVFGLKLPLGFNWKSLEIAQNLILITGSFCILLLQYAKKRNFLAWGFVCFFAITYRLIFWLPIGSIPLSNTISGENESYINSLKSVIEWDQLVVGSSNGLIGDNIEGLSLHADLQIEGLKNSHFSFTRDLTEIVLKDNDSGKQYDTEAKQENSLFRPYTSLDRGEFLSALQSAMYGGRVINLDQRHLQTFKLIDLSRPSFKEIENKPLSYSAELVYDIFTYERSFALEVEKGSSFRRDNRHLIIRDIKKGPERFEIEMEERKLNLMFHSSGIADIEVEYNSASADIMSVYALYNEKQGEILLEKIDKVYGSFGYSSPAMVSRTTERIVFANDSRSGSFQWPSEDWFKEAKLVQLEARNIAGNQKLKIVSDQIFKVQGIDWN